VKCTVHPHARGDNYNGGSEDPWNNGSPPRPWGQCVFCRLASQSARFTPTPVGTIPAAARLAAAAPVHPHARGDNLACRLDLSQHVGSPPRPWGQCRRRSGSIECCRFTPTPVGTIRSVNRWGLLSTVHPHARGDNNSAMVMYSATAGSPPRPWGQSGPGGVGDPPARFTPTPVGTISSAWRRRSRSAGSPPRPWGQ